jgi:hypothetical protein
MSRKIMLLVCLTTLAAGSARAADDVAQRLLGDVLVRSQGTTVLVAIDDAETPERALSRAFKYQLATPLADDVNLRLRAELLVRKDRLVITSPEGPTRLVLALAGSRSAASTQATSKSGFAREIQWLDGIGLADYVRPAALSLDELAVADLEATATRQAVECARSAPAGSDFFGWLEPVGGCPSGGPGSSSCSIHNCCSVTCTSGYYACCHCSDGCRCVSGNGSQS